MSYFVTGTDTGVGKTLISCALLHAFAGKGLRAVGMKPIASGCDATGWNEDVTQLKQAGNMRVPHDLINPYRFQLAVAPHIAAQQVGVQIDLWRVRDAYEELAGQADIVIVEGVGGFRVPLNETQDMADLARELGLPVILVVGMRLGCLNHALLTLRSIGDCGLECAGWVANVLDASMTALPENIATLQQRMAVPLLGVVEHQAQVDARTVAKELRLEILENN